MKTYLQKHENIKYSDHYSTPEHIYNYYMGLNYYDPCPLQHNDFDFRIIDLPVFLNPPYSNITKWIDWIIENYKQTGKKATILIPSRTDTKYFHKLLNNVPCDIEFIKGRLKFGGLKKSAPFPSILIHIKEADHVR